jgi:hypothetical protein
MNRAARGHGIAGNARTRCLAGERRALGGRVVHCLLVCCWAQLVLAPPVQAQRFRELSGRHLTLITDLAESPEVDTLPAVFDQAVPLWRAYFALDERALADWRVTGYLMGDSRLFHQAGLVPDDLPVFLNGYARANQLWVFNQPTGYYRRHLVLHEGVHALMLASWRGYGPAWYAEGIAELLATHTWENGKLVLPVFPAEREAFAGWGRIKLVREEVVRPDAPTLQTLLDRPASAFLQNEAYGWAWAACAFLDGHPRWQPIFRQLKQHVRLRQFNQRFQAAVGEAWPELVDEFSVFAWELEYGHDLPRWAMQFGPGERLPESGASVRVRADGGWQSSGIALQAGESYRLRARGRYQVAAGPPPWRAEANGVSIRYYRGRPLGMLLAAVRVDGKEGAPVAARTRHAGFLSPVAVGLDAAMTPEQTGTLYLKINDSPAELHDNQGVLEVLVERMQPERENKQRD